MALRAELTADGADARPHTIAVLPARQMPAPPSVTTIWRILTRAGLIRPRATQTTETILDPIRRGPAQRVLAGRLHPLAPGPRAATSKS